MYEKEQKTRPLFSALSPFISSFQLERTHPLATEKRENPPCIMHKGIMNDSSSTSLEKQRQGLEIFIFISDLFELVM